MSILPIWPKSLFTLIGVSLLWLAPGKLIALSRFSWEAVDRAEYYFLVLSFKEQTVSARTSATFVLLEADADVNLWAFDKKNHLLGKFPVHSTKLDRPRQDPPAHKSPPSAAKPKKIKKTREQIKEQEKIKQLEKEREQAFTSRSVRHLSVQLGLGKERIKARGGDSEFLGSSYTSATRAQVDIELASKKNMWQRKLQASLHSHLFATREVEATTEAEAISEKTNLYQRFHVRAALVERWNLHPRHSLAGLLGLGASQIPLLQTSNADTGAADLTSQPYFGPGLGLSYEYSQNPRLSYQATLFYLPLAMGQLKKTQAIDIETRLRYFFQPNIFAESSHSAHSEELRYSLLCPENAAPHCQTATSLSSTWQLFHLGLGLKF